METDIQISSSLGEEKKVLAQLEQILQLSGCSENDRMDLKTALAEACLNAIEHGNGLNPGLNVDIHILVKNETVTIEVYDHGQGAKLQMQPLFRKNEVITGEFRGWGLRFIDTLVDDWGYGYQPEKKRFCLRMTKSFGKVR